MADYRIGFYYIMENVYGKPPLTNLLSYPQDDIHKGNNKHPS